LRPASSAAAAVLLIVAALLAGGCDSTEDVYRARFTAMGTLVDVNIAGAPSDEAAGAAAAVEALFRDREVRWDPWGNGELGILNEALAGTGGAMPSGDLSGLLADAAGISALTEGRFDPAVGTLTRLWGFSREDDVPTAPPDPGAVDATVAALRPITELLGPDGRLSGAAGARIDLGGFAKGVAVDEAIAVLRARGVSDAIVNAGGDLRAYGRAGNRPWRIGIRHPRGDGIIAGLEIDSDESVFTSGDYERFFEVDGRRYHHILDPATGYPAPGIRSVTVVNQDAALADAAATALFVAGPDGWPAVAARLGLDQVMVIDSEGRIHLSPAMQERLWFPGDGPPGDQIVIRNIP
jgi:thiamine biosynthesis lipoprotein